MGQNTGVRDGLEAALTSDAMTAIVGRQVMEQLLAMARREGSALVYVTHSRDLAAMADEIWSLHSGVLDRSQGSP